MIEIKNISKLFGSKKALDNINITLYPGEIAALIGENGAGKSTLMRVMCGYLHPDTGSVNIFGHNTEKDRIKALSYIGYVPEISSLYGEMTVYGMDCRHLEHFQQESIHFHSGKTNADK